MRVLPHLQIRKIEGYMCDPSDGSHMPFWSKEVNFLYSPLSAKIIKNNAQIEKIINIQNNNEENETQKVMIELKELSFLSENKDFQIEVQEGHDKLELYLELTQLCNFKCPGCAVGLDSIADNMRFDLDINKTQEMLSKAFAMAKENGFEKVKIKYAGGEPLLNNAKKLIRQIHETVRELAEKNKLETDEVIITNGSLLKHSIDFIKELGLRVNVSFWGYGEGNDKERKSCGMTFGGIIEGLTKVISAKIPLSITFVITATNTDQISPLLRILYDQKSEKWIGKKAKIDSPIPVHIAFFRPQNILQYHVFQKQQGHKKIIAGVRNAIATFVDILQKGFPLPYLGNAFDYLDIDNTFTATCGSGSAYIALGSCGANSCHEALRNEKNVDSPDNLRSLIQSEVSLETSEDLSGLDTHRLTLMLHGGRGCPRIRRIEKRLTNHPSYATSVYLPIIEEIIALEAMRRESVSYQ